MGEAADQEIELAIEKDGRRSFAIGVTGFVIMMSGGCITLGASSWIPQWANTIGFGLQTAGTSLLIVGLAFYARKKGRSAILGGFGLLSWIGILVLAAMPKLCRRCSSRVGARAAQCKECGAPA